jgi:hypothetical protein
MLLGDALLELRQRLLGRCLKVLLSAGSLWVIGGKHTPSEVRSKTIIYDLHLEPRFGKLSLDEITTPVVARFRADLVAKKLNNLLRCCPSR